MIRKLTGLALFILILGVSLWLIWTMQVPQTMSDTDAMVVANSLYEAGNYEETVQVYEQIISTGVRNSHVFFNLGNAYFQHGEIGLAILNYERALEITPRDEDIKHNLSLARAEAGISHNLPAHNPVLELARRSKVWISLHEISVFALATWIMSGSLITLYLITSKRGMRKLIGTIIILSLFITLGASITLTTRLVSKTAGSTSIVIEPNTLLRDQPNGDSEQAIELPAGMHTQVIERYRNWVHITTSDQIIEGWAPGDAIESIAF